MYQRDYLDERANGLRYPRVGGTRQRRFAGTSFEPKKLPENAATPTRRVHAVLGCVLIFVFPTNHKCLQEQGAKQFETLRQFPFADKS